MFGSPISEYQLTKLKLGRMAVITQASRQFSYAVAKMMGKGEGAMEASMVKAYVCKAAEWSPVKQCRSTAVTATPRNIRFRDFSSMHACCQSSKEQTRHCA